MNNGTVLFVCTGNICRSPMAEYLFRRMPGGKTRWTAGSAGTHALDGMPASPAAVAALRERSIDLSPHRSRRLTGELIDAATVIVVMTSAHSDEVKAVCPGASEKLFLLRSFAAMERSGDIADPMGMTLEIYRTIRNEIEECLPGLAAFLHTLE